MACRGAPSYVGPDSRLLWPRELCTDRDRAKQGAACGHPAPVARVAVRDYHHHPCRTQGEVGWGATEEEARAGFFTSPGASQTALSRPPRTIDRWPLLGAHWRMTVAFWWGFGHL